MHCSYPRLINNALQCYRIGVIRINEMLDLHKQISSVQLGRYAPVMSTSATGGQTLRAAAEYM
jgi:hypothetical protein